MYETILVPYDGSADAKKGARHGVDLAAAVGATVHALYVFREGGNPWESASMADQDERAMAHGEAVLDEVAELAEAAGVEFVGAVRIGPRVFEEINEHVEDEAVDLVVIGSGYHGEFGGLLGSTADKLLRTARVPVLTIRREPLD